MKKRMLTIAGMLLALTLVSAGMTLTVSADGETLVYGSGDYTRINPAMDEHGEINILLFNGLTAHDGDNQVVPSLAESWEFDEETNTYTFHIYRNRVLPFLHKELKLLFRDFQISFGFLIKVLFQDQSV